MNENGQLHHYLSFRVGSQWYGVEVREVFEVLHMVALTELPAAPPEMLGLMTVRDRVIPVVDMRRLFKKAEAPLRLDTPIIALTTSEGSVGLAVDDVDDVEEIAGTQITRQNNTRSPYINGIARLSDHLLLLVDSARIRAEAEISEVQAPAAD